MQEKLKDTIAIYKTVCCKKINWVLCARLIYNKKDIVYMYKWGDTGSHTYRMQPAEIDANAFALKYCTDICEMYPNYDIDITNDDMI